MNERKKEKKEQNKKDSLERHVKFLTRRSIARCLMVEPNDGSSAKAWCYSRVGMVCRGDGHDTASRVAFAALCRDSTPVRRYIITGKDDVVRERERQNKTSA